MTQGHFLSSEYDNICPLSGGSGGQGTVFKARHREFGQVRAVKWLHGSIEPSPDDRSQPNKSSRLYQVFIREARSLMQLNAAYHPNIVRIYNARLIQHHTLWFPILEMELIEGTDLNTLIEQAGGGGLPVALVETLLNQMAAALAYCHSLEVIHRDIKSHNGMQDRRVGRFVLVDYGLSLLAGEPISQDRRGTPQYMSPEQFEGADPTFQSDLYSLGVVLYEALTGQLPFGPEPSNDLWRFYGYSHHRAAVIPIRSVRPDVPAWLDDVIRICLAKNPRDRFADGQALVAYLAAKSVITPAPAGVFIPEPVPGLTLPASEWAAGQRPPRPADESVVTSQTLPAPLAASQQRHQDPQSVRVDQTSPAPRKRRQRWQTISVVLLLLGLLSVVYWKTLPTSSKTVTEGGAGSAEEQAMSRASVLQRAGQYGQAAEIYQRLVDAGNQSAYKPLFKLYMSGWAGGEERCHKAFTLLKMAADANDYQACNLLGYVYEFGEYINRGTRNAICQYTPNPALAFRYVKKGAEGGNAESMRQVADYYRRGFGTVLNLQAAEHWQVKARELPAGN